MHDAILFLEAYIVEAGRLLLKVGAMLLMTYLLTMLITLAVWRKPGRGVQRGEA